MLRLAFAAFLGLLHFAAASQSAQARRDSQRQLREDIARHEEQIRFADSSGDARGSARWRIMLAGIVQPAKRAKLLEDAAARADSASHHEEELRARSLLLEHYQEIGDHKRALLQSLRINEAERAARALEVERDAGEAADLIRAHQHERDSLLALHESESGLARTAIGQAQKEVASREAMIIALGAAVLVLAVVIVLILARQRKSRIRFTKEVATLQSRVAELAKFMEGLAAQAREPAALPELQGPPVAPSAVVAPGPSSATAVDPIVLGLFKRQAPERIAALDTARAAGDHEKVLRVLHSLRPQLDAIDPAGLGALCTGLRAMQPSDTGRDAGLDRLIAGMNALLARS